METLNHLAPGETGRITKITATDQMKNRLMDLGFIEGAKVEMLNCAPLGDPILVRVFGAVLALRKNEADTIGITRTNGEESAGGKRYRHRFGWKSKQRKDQPL